MGTNTEIHFLPVDESHTHALSRNTKHLRLDGQVCFFRRLFSDTVKLRGCISWSVWPLRGINKTAWGAKLILTAGQAYPVSCASLGHPLMAQHCHLCLSVCFKDCMGCQTDSNGRAGLPSQLCQSGSPTDGTALPFVFECLL